MRFYLVVNFSKYLLLHNNKIKKQKGADSIKIVATITLFGTAFGKGLDSENYSRKLVADPSVKLSIRAVLGWQIDL